MSPQQNVALSTADDGFEAHYREKIWNLIPEIYRHEDGLAQSPGQLRAFVEIVALEAATARRNVDRLWTDTRIDLADDWAVSYIGNLLGTRVINSLNLAGRRADVKHTIRYRKRNGTRSLMETLADDIGDWDAVASEAFQRLFRTMHLLDGPSERGDITDSPRWGFADLRSPRISDTLDGPFDDLSHLPDFRRGRGKGGLGRYNIPKVALHLFRHHAFMISNVTPHAFGNGRWTLDPSGRDITLYQRGGTPADECEVRRPWVLRSPMECRRLNAAVYQPEVEHVPIPFQLLLAPLYGRRFEFESRLLEEAVSLVPAMDLPQNAALLLGNAMIDECPKKALLSDQSPYQSVSVSIDPIGGALVPPHELYGANLENWAPGGTPNSWIDVLIDPTTARVISTDSLLSDSSLRVPFYYYGALVGLGAGAHDRPVSFPDNAPILSVVIPDLSAPRSGVDIIDTNQTYPVTVPANDTITVTDTWSLIAKNRCRPYVTISPTLAAAQIFVVSANNGSELVIDGIWLGILTGAGGEQATSVVLQGNWQSVCLRNVTFDPGGSRATAPGDPSDPIPSVRLVLDGEVEDLVIDNCVLGGLIESVTEVDPCSAHRITIQDSLIYAQPDQAAVDVPSAQLTIERSTLLGDLKAGVAMVSNSIIDGQVFIENAQESCFRFSTAIESQHFPQPYESTIYPSELPPDLFQSRRFGDANVVQLSELAPAKIAAGGEDDTEMGVYNRALLPVKANDLRTKLDEFTPINAIVQMIYEN